MPSTFKVSNFKCIEKARFDFGKLNLFIGPNNSGKTSALQALAFVLQGKLLGSAFEGEFISLRPLREFVFRKDINRSLEFSLTLSFNQEELQRIKEWMAETPFKDFDFSSLTVEFAFPVGKNLSYTQATSISAKLLDRAGKLILGVEGSPRKKDLLPEGLRKEDVGEISLSGFIPYSSKHSKEWGELHDLLRKEKLRNFFWLKTLRTIGSIPKEVKKELSNVGQHGEDTLDVLADIRDDEDYVEVWDKISEWITRFGFKDEIIPRHEGEGKYSLLLRDADLNIRVLKDHLGFGIDQLLPVIVQCFYTRKGEPKEAIIFIEQPETHLHPAMQAEVADLFIDAVGWGKQLIVETHSEHLLLRLQRRIAEGKISHEDVGIFYFEKTQEGTSVKRVELDEIGRFKEKKPFPGFFEVEFEDAIKQTEAIFQRFKKKDGEGSGP